MTSVSAMVSAFLSSPSPLAIKAELVGLLGSKGRQYWRVLSEFLKAKISRTEFEELVTEWINTARLGRPDSSTPIVSSDSYLFYI